MGQDIFYLQLSMLRSIALTGSSNQAYQDLSSYVQLSYCWETARRESLPKIAMNVETQPKS